MSLQNTSIGTIETAASISPGVLGWLITIGIFITIIVTIFLLSKNFRKFLYGSVVTAILMATYSLSRWIGTATAIEKDYVPIKGVSWVIGFIITSIIIGYFMMKLKFIKEWEKMWLK